jgi:hypothetical protein
MKRALQQRIVIDRSAANAMWRVGIHQAFETRRRRGREAPTARRMQPNLSKKDAHGGKGKERV